MGNVRKLTTKQHKFAVLLVTKGDRMSAKECAIEAGFFEKASHNNKLQIYRILKCFL